ncbi:MAG: TrpB-like pyridoxal phosphate-dependent enzyme [Aquificota bacterium]|nr:MAG: TrpB-like pyridoxal phosphate-dependent enzyme [Aquificota bacterium]
MERVITLDPQKMPKEWYNALVDLPKPLEPPLNPATGKPLTPQDLAPLFPPALIEQEMSQERWIPIPREVLEVYALWRPTPLYRAWGLEKALNTPARIYYKYEGTSPAGSHKPNTAVAQAYYNAQSGIKRLTTETGAGQWGSALAFATKFFGLECTVYMVRVSYEQKPYRRTMMEVWGGKVYPSPSDKTQTGRSILEQDPDNPGSLGIAISEAVEDAVTHEDTHYALGSVLNHVLLHQTVIGLEAKEQLAQVGDYPDVVIGCCGGGSNLGGIALPFLADKATGKEVRLMAVEPKACPTLTKGAFTYDFGDTARMTPLLKMYTLGHNFVPPSIHAGGLRYHGDSPIISLLVREGAMEAAAYYQTEVFEAGLLFARTEGFIPAPETNHAIKAAIDEAIKAKEEGEERVILFNFSGHGLLDLSSYDAFFKGELQDYELSDDEIKRALEELEKLAVR